MSLKALAGAITGAEKVTITLSPGKEAGQFQCVFVPVLGPLIMKVADDETMRIRALLARPFVINGEKADLDAQLETFLNQITEARSEIAASYADVLGAAKAEAKQIASAKSAKPAAKSAPKPTAKPAKAASKKPKATKPTKAAPTVAPSEPPPTAPAELAQPRKCRQCSCDDMHACVTDAGPCSWAETFDDNTGICSACAVTEPAATSGPNLFEGV